MNLKKVFAKIEWSWYRLLLFCSSLAWIKSSATVPKPIFSFAALIDSAFQSMTVGRRWIRFFRHQPWICPMSKSIDFVLPLAIRSFFQECGSCCCVGCPVSPSSDFTLWTDADGRPRRARTDTWCRSRPIRIDLNTMPKQLLMPSQFAVHRGFTPFIHALRVKILKASDECERMNALWPQCQQRTHNFTQQTIRPNCHSLVWKLKIKSQQSVSFSACLSWSTALNGRVATVFTSLAWPGTIALALATLSVLATSLSSVSHSQLSAAAKQRFSASSTGHTLKQEQISHTTHTQRVKEMFPPSNPTRDWDRLEPAVGARSIGLPPPFSFDD